MQARIKNPALVLEGANEAIQALIKSIYKAGVPQSVLELIHIRVSQINGCSACLDMSAKSALKAGGIDEKLFGVAAWREMPYFSDAERAALELSEAVTRQADHPNVVTDQIWATAAEHFDEKQLAGIVTWIATTNLFNRVNATVRQPAGEWTP